MPTNYPGALDTTGGNLKNNWTNTDATDVVHPAAHNNVADALIAVETELGTDPSGTFATVASRLAARSTVRLTADSSTFTTQTLANLTGMSFSVAASSDYYFKFVIAATAGAARGIGVGVTCPASPTGMYYSATIFGHAANSGTAVDAAVTSFAAASGTRLFNSPTAGLTTILVVVEGILANGTNAGTLQFQCSQGGGGTAVNVVAKKGSYGELYLN